MQIAIDIGNTRAKVAFFREREIHKHIYVEHRYIGEKIAELKSEYKELIISSTKNFSSLNISENLLKDILVLDTSIPLPIEISYKTPQTLGNDRIANVIGGINLYPDQNLLIIDAGTCITYDFVNEKRQFLGGNISPGLHLRIKGMNSYTDKLPLIDLSEDYSFIGENTEEALNNGVWNGCIGEIDHYCDKFKTEFTNTAIILTGGDTEIFGKALKNTIFANPFLTLIGLNEILLFNRN